MPRLVHEPWCVNHGFGIGDELGQCQTVEVKFGPIDEDEFSVGAASGYRIGDEDIDVYVDYRTLSGGRMDVNALRAVREALAESPVEFLYALDRLIEALGPDVPPAHRVPSEAVAS